MYLFVEKGVRQAAIIRSIYNTHKKKQYMKRDLQSEYDSNDDRNEVGDSILSIDVERLTDM